jgi:predicted GNAT family acetyltransferase
VDQRPPRSNLKVVSTEVINNATDNRYELHVDGALAGYIRYKARPAGLALIHTSVLPEFEGRGLGAVLAKGALDDIRAAGGKVLPLCPYVAAYINAIPSTPISSRLDSRRPTSRFDKVNTLSVFPTAPRGE